MPFTLCCRRRWFAPRPLALPLLLFAPLLGTTPGCNSGPAPAQVPRYEPGEFATALLERCDTDGNGSLSQEEAAAAPGLVAAWERYDLDKDATISRDELAARVQKWIDRGDALVPIRCAVRLKGQQLGGVTVKFLPDDSMEGVVQPAEAVSHESRGAAASISPELKPEALKNFSGMQYGLYRVEVSHPDMQLEPTPESAGRDIGPADQAGTVRINVRER